MRRRFACIFCAALTVPIIGHAEMTEVSCDDTERLASTLATVIGAERQGKGLRDPDTMLEIWVTQRSGDWVIVQNYANGTSCIVAMGEHWQGKPLGPA